MQTNAIPTPSDNNRFALEVWIIPLLYGRIKRVHINMNDLADGHLANHLIRGARRVRAQFRTSIRTLQRWVHQKSGCGQEKRQPSLDAQSYP